MSTENEPVESGKCWKCIHPACRPKMTTDPKPPANRDLTDPFIIFTDPREGDRFECGDSERIIQLYKGEFWVFNIGTHQMPTKWYLQERNTLFITNIRPVPNPAEKPQAAKVLGVLLCKCGHTGSCEYCRAGGMTTPSREDSSASLATRPQGAEAERPPAVRVFVDISPTPDTYWVFGRRELPECWQYGVLQKDFQKNITAEKMSTLKWGWRELPPAESTKWCEEHPLKGASNETEINQTSNNSGRHNPARIRDDVSNSTDGGGVQGSQKDGSLVSTTGTKSTAEQKEGALNIPSPDAPGKSDPNAGQGHCVIRTSPMGGKFVGKCKVGGESEKSRLAFRAMAIVQAKVNEAYENGRQAGMSSFDEITKKHQHARKLLDRIAQTAFKNGVIPIALVDDVCKYLEGKD
jgi:hypothetical protein